MIELGSKVKDVLTGFVGRAVGRHEYLFGCTRYSVQPCTKKNATGTLEAEKYFDEPQLRVLAPPTRVIAARRKKATKVKNPGGPMLSVPVQKTAPTRS